MLPLEEALGKTCAKFEVDMTYRSRVRTTTLFSTDCQLKDPQFTFFGVGAGQRGNGADKLRYTRSVAYSAEQFC